MRIVEVLMMLLGGFWQAVRQDFNWLEIAIILATIWAWKRGWRPRGSKSVLHLNPWAEATLLIAATICLRLALLGLLPQPIPVVTDEFSHLLLADTLAHGRLANPTHPFWPHFESIHILQKPHYISNYFPGRAAVLAAGIALFHNPWIAVLGECVVFLATLYWMLRGWMPPGWALFGLLLGAVRFGIGSYWMNSYYGGFVAAIGGALIAGAYPRLTKSASMFYASVFGLGLAILALTRPFEGFFFGLVWVAALAWHYRRSVMALVKIAVPVAVFTGAAVVTLGVYLKNTTGSSFVTAYQISEETYGWPIDMPWTRPHPGIHYQNIELARHYEYERSEHEKVDGPVNFIEYLTFHLESYWRFYLGPLLTIPLVMLPNIWRRRRMLVLGAAGAIFAILVEGVSLPHYLAPAAAVLIAMVVEGCRYLRFSKGPAATIRLLPAALALVLAVRIGAQAAGLPYTQRLNYQSWCCVVQGNMNKARITASLEKIPGQHLVFVKPKSDAYNLLQWIYNGADIDGAKIVWARDMGPERNAALASHFGGRDLWLVDPNVEPASCQKY